MIAAQSDRAVLLSRAYGTTPLPLEGDAARASEAELARVVRSGDGKPHRGSCAPRFSIADQRDALSTGRTRIYGGSSRCRMRLMSTCRSATRSQRLKPKPARARPRTAARFISTRARARYGHVSEKVYVGVCVVRVRDRLVPICMRTLAVQRNRQLRRVGVTAQLRGSSAPVSEIFTALLRISISSLSRSVFP